MASPDSTDRHDGTTRRNGRVAHADGTFGDAPFRRLVDRSPDGIVVHQDGRVVYANLTAVRWVGAQYADQVLGQPLVDFIHADSIESVLTRMAALRHDGDVTRASEGVLLRLDGTTLDVESVTTLTTWQGSPAYHVTLRDLTFVRTAQRSLRYQAGLVDRVDVAIIATTVTGLVTKWNRAAEVIYQRPAANALATPIGEAVGATFDPAAVVESGGVVLASHQTADGQPLIVRMSVSPLDTGYVLACTDETKSRGGERLLRKIVNSLEEGILVVDGTGSVTSVNPAAERILGQSAAAMVGGDGRAVHRIPMYDASRHPIDPRDHPVAQTVRTGRPFQGSIIGIDRPDGRRTWLRVSCRPLDSDDRHGMAILVSFSDITAEQVARERLTYRATHDALTGLPNRAAILNQIADSLRAHGDRRLGAVLFIDLDNLKAINDSLGHDCGDELLQSVGRCLRASVGPNDVVGRLGGDEFVTLVAGDASPAELASYVIRLERNLAEPMKLGAATVRTQGSIGVTVVAPEDERTAIEILRDADSAMYATKAKRRRRVYRKPGGTAGPPPAAGSRNGDGQLR
ncbi:diguanylate cyclase [Mycolicibacterium sp. P1-18]|uniref:diguanylate cyclase domain-containing protein n=1 Tax=Mycolicibacterium sp. P1-18 TaxID=2024615 RepID=UPI0011F250CE|nr:diguanylate cyclase [Mycolicibacterium sp. P1-18]KAA0098673.1 diguanylate cyclase [Mycolicibacterium sp. P1-18]